MRELFSSFLLVILLPLALMAMECDPTTQTPSLLKEIWGEKHQDSGRPAYLSEQDIVNFNKLFKRQITDPESQFDNPFAFMIRIKGKFLKDRSFRQGESFQHIWENLCIILTGDEHHFVSSFTFQGTTYQNITSFVEAIMATAASNKKNHQMAKISMAVETATRVQMLMLREAKFYQLLYKAYGTYRKKSENHKRYKKAIGRMKGKVFTPFFERYVLERANLFDFLFFQFRQSCQYDLDTHSREKRVDLSQLIFLIQKEIQEDLIYNNEEIETVPIDVAFKRKYIYKAIHKVRDSFYNQLWHKYLHPFHEQVSYYVFMNDFGIQQFFKNKIFDGDYEFREFVETLRETQRMEKNPKSGGESYFHHLFVNSAQVRSYFKDNFMEERFRKIVFSLLVANPSIWGEKIDGKAMLEEEKLFHYHLFDRVKELHHLSDLDLLEGSEKGVYLDLMKYENVSKNWLKIKCRELRKDYKEYQENYWDELDRSLGYVSKINIMPTLKGTRIQSKIYGN